MKKYKIWIRHGVQEGWLHMDEHGIHFYTNFNDATKFKQQDMRSVLKEIKGRKVTNLDVRPYRFRESKYEKVNKNE